MSAASIIELVVWIVLYFLALLVSAGKRRDNAS